MKRGKSPYLNDSKTFDCITRFQLIPPNIVPKDNPLFSAFSKTKLKKHISNEVQDAKNNKSQNFINELKFYDDANNKSLLLGRGQMNQNILEGVLRARKSQMKKIKLKQFYLEEYCNDKEQINQKNNQNYVSCNLIESKNSTQFNTIESKPLSTVSNNLPSTRKKKILPVKLRARSYSNIPKNLKDRTVEAPNDQNSLLIKPQKNMSLHLVEKKLSKYAENNQSSINLNPRKFLRSQGRKKNIHNQRNILGDMSLRFNQMHGSVASQKHQKQGLYKSLKNKRNIRSQCITKLHQNLFEINPWANNNNDEDKQNDYFIF